MISSGMKVHPQSHSFHSVTRYYQIIHGTCILRSYCYKQTQYLYYVTTLIEMIVIYVTQQGYLLQVCAVQTVNLPSTCQQNVKVINININRFFHKVCVMELKTFPIRNSQIVLSFRRSKIMLPLPVILLASKSLLQVKFRLRMGGVFPYPIFWETMKCYPSDAWMHGPDNSVKQTNLKLALSQ